MKYTNKKRNVFNKNRKKRQIRQFIMLFTACVAITSAVCGIYFRFRISKFVASYENAAYEKNIYTESLFLDELCTANENVQSEDFLIDGDIHAVGLFNLYDKETIYAQDIHSRIFPASTTKLLTAYIAIKYGNLEDVITVSKNAIEVPLDSSRAGLYTGDQLTLESLLYGLMLPSGNDCGVAIAEYISGSEGEFAKLMNAEAQKLGATNSHFVNAHGYHDEEHYTTAYDLYLIMNACIQQNKLIEIFSSNMYTTRIIQKNGTYRDVTWTQTNRFINGSCSTPDGIEVIGGKTGTTDQAGSCLVLYEKSSVDKPYISIVMGSDNGNKLYDNMTRLMTLITD